MIYDSKLWCSDIDEELLNLSFLENLEGKSVMITGATGLICSAVTDILIRYNETHEGKIEILAAGRCIDDTKQRFGYYVRKDYFSFVPYDATKIDNSFTIPCDYIIHGASNAYPRKIIKEPVETMFANFVGIKSLLDYAKEYDIKRVLYISSSEVYGKKDENKPFRIDEYGYINLLDQRSSYSMGKCATETLCISYTYEYGVESVIVRPGHIYGPTASPKDNRVASEWVYNAARNQNIVMKSDGKQLRSYCYCLDCASAILTALLCGENKHAYNISNPNSIINIKEMAELLSRITGVQLIYDEAIAEDIKGFNPMRNSSLDSKDLESLGWKGLFDAERGFKHTVAILKETI